MAAAVPTGRLIDHAPGSGAWNMAIDEVLLASAADRGMLTLRFYRWSEPTVSLGYFQGFNARQSHLASVNCPLVRRASGGGAIIHDQELTYSLAVPASLVPRAPANFLYDTLHDSLVDALRSWGISAHKHRLGANVGCAAVPSRNDSRVEKSSVPSTNGGDPSATSEPFLCFQRRACGDVLLDQFKICGSAQRRLRGAILQHGSVLLGMSAAAKELPGIRELSGITLPGSELMAGWWQRVAAKLLVRFESDELTPLELAQARSITVEKHLSRAWLMRR